MTHRFFALAFSLALAFPVTQAQAQRAPAVPAAPAAFVPPSQGIDPNELAVQIANKSVPVLCAEKDNVELNMSAPNIRRFRIQAVHPAYIGSIVVDRWAPDFTACDMSHDTSFKSNARRKTFWETPEYWLVGYTYPSFWRPGNVPVRVGDHVETGLHMIQLWMRYRERAEEVLVLYPPDGYWRARPLPFADMRWTSYGSSFLLGPVETQERPIVALKSVAFDPDTLTFTLDYVRGGSAKLKIDTIDQERIVLNASFSGDLPKDLPFASMRSMYATEFNSDVARVAWRSKNSESWGESPIMTYPGGLATEIWAGRIAPSQHNKSAPDMVFSHFSDQPTP
ncbi:MAG: hypothetical protein JWL62_2855 [Hyphomicrobiales bacterium]|nr:hypothetical protein [Hyphomicrobiales bacterium]